MGYTPTTWQSGDTVTASALNKIEQGIANAGGAVLLTPVIDTTNEIIRLGYSYNELESLIRSGYSLIFYMSNELKELITDGEDSGSAYYLDIIIQYDSNQSEYLFSPAHLMDFTAYDPDDELVVPMSRGGNTK